MPWDKSQSHRRPLFEPDPDHIFAGMIIGDDWVQAVLMHVEPSGAMQLMGSSLVNIATYQRQIPALPSLQVAVGKAWMRLGVPQNGYARFFLCLPPWCTKSWSTSAEIQIPHGSSNGTPRPPIVTPHHIRKLEHHIDAANIPPQYIIAEAVPRGYVLDDGRTVADAVGMTTKSLKLNSHLMLAEEHTTSGILDWLKKLGVSVDMITTPSSTIGHVLTAAQMETGAAVLDVDRLGSTYSFYKQGTLLESLFIRGGSEDIHAAVAEDLEVQPPAFQSSVAAWKESLSPTHDDPFQTLPLFDHAGENSPLQKLKAAAARRGEHMIGQINRALSGAQLTRLEGCPHIALVGEDFLTLQTITEAMPHFTPATCCRQTGNIHTQTHTHPGLPAATRAVGLMRLGAFQSTHRQHFLRRYNATILDVVVRRVADAAREIFHPKQAKEKPIRKRRQNRRIAVRVEAGRDESKRRRAIRTSLSRHTARDANPLLFK